MRLRAIFDYCKWDPQCGDREVLARFPLFLATQTVRHLAAMAEALTSEALRAETEIAERPELLSLLGIPDPIRNCWRVAGNHGPTNHVRVMRFDFHHTTEGWRISEVNADVPGGYVEASGWNALFAEQYEAAPAPPDPTCEYAKAICAGLKPGSLIALAHATVYSEDRQVMVYLGQELQRRGMRAILVGPEHLRWSGGIASLQTLFARERPAFIVRLSPAEWLPNCGAPQVWSAWFGETSTPLSNPGQALVLQSKRFPLAWDALGCDLPTWRRLLPESRCPSQVREIETGGWVIKPAFGRVGEDVGIRGVTGAREFQEIQRAMRRRPGGWIAQRRFCVLPVETDDGEIFPCIGVYTVNGKFAGLYARAARFPLINGEALDVAILQRVTRNVQ